MPARLATALWNFQSSHGGAAETGSSDKLDELTPIARDASAKLKRVVDVDLAQLNKAINEAGIPRIAPSRKP